jgi:hypothetical protein
MPVNATSDSHAENAALFAKRSVSGHEIRFANWTPASRVGIAL